MQLFFFSSEKKKMSRERNVLIGLLTVVCLLQFDAIADVIVTPCPTNCECSKTSASPGIGLAIDCHSRSGIDPQQLYDQIDSLLISNVNSELVSLTIQNSSLSRVPRSLCRLTTLEKLHIRCCRLENLPKSCFTNLTRLTWLRVDGNNITDLPNGVFDGMGRLNKLYLTRNQIASIGTAVFSNLTSLGYINLANNRLKTLEPWWYELGLKTNVSGNVLISVSDNNISEFTNDMGWRFHCGMPVPRVTLELSGNPINYISDIANGWNISTPADFFCLFANANTHLVLRKIFLTCDCTDFPYISFVKKSPRPIFDSVICRNTSQTPPDIAGHRVMHVLPAQFVCVLTNRCPSACRCVHRPADATLHIDCSNTNRTDLPDKLPQLPQKNTKYELDFSNNRLLRRLEGQSYFANTSILDVSNCSIESVSGWDEIAKIPRIKLPGNKLTSFPQSIVAVNVSTEKLNIAENRWDCSCGSKWMSGWLKSIQNRLTRPVLCYSPTRLHGKNIIQISDKEFCVDPADEATKTAWTISMSSVAGVVIVLLSVGVIVYRLRVKLYTRFNWFHPFDRDECRGEDMDYDVFLSFSAEDDDQIRLILNRLENNNNGYRVCYPDRDFRPGLISENIEAALKRSKRTLCFLTVNFIRRFASLPRSLVFLLFLVCWRSRRSTANAELE